MTNYMTVVYKINDREAFEEERNRIMSKFTIDDLSWSVTAASTDHEIQRVQLIEQALEVYDFDTIRQILDHQDVGNIDSLSELGEL